MALFELHMTASAASAHAGTSKRGVGTMYNKSHANDGAKISIFMVFFPIRKRILGISCSSTWLENQSSQKWRRFGIDIETM